MFVTVIQEMAKKWTTSRTKDKKMIWDSFTVNTDYLDCDLIKLETVRYLSNGIINLLFVR